MKFAIGVVALVCSAYAHAQDPQALFGYYVSDNGSSQLVMEGGIHLDKKSACESPGTKSYMTGRFAGPVTPVYKILPGVFDYCEVIAPNGSVANFYFGGGEIDYAWENLWPTDAANIPGKVYAVPIWGQKWHETKEEACLETARSFFINGMGSSWEILHFKSDPDYMMIGNRVPGYGLNHRGPGGADECVLGARHPLTQTVRVYRFSYAENNASAVAFVPTRVPTYQPQQCEVAQPWWAESPPGWSYLNDSRDARCHQIVDMNAAAAASQ